MPRTANGAGLHRKAEGERTRELLMDAAEALFAAQGVEGTSVRSINTAAGQGAASVHYHFGDRDALVRAVIERRGRGLVARQAELLDELEGRRRRPRADEVVRLLADPMFELLRAEPEGGGRWLAVVAGLVAGDDERVYQVGFGPGSVQQRINAAAAAAFPAVAESVVAHRWRLASTALLGLLASESGRLSQPDEAVAADELDQIVAFVASGLAGSLRHDRGGVRHP